MKTGHLRPGAAGLSAGRNEFSGGWIPRSP